MWSQTTRRKRLVCAAGSDKIWAVSSHTHVEEAISGKQKLVLQQAFRAKVDSSKNSSGRSGYERTVFGHTEILSGQAGLATRGVRQGPVVN